MKQDLHLEVLSVTQSLETTPTGKDQKLHELLLFPEVTTFGHKLSKIQQQARSLATKLVEKEDASTYHRRAIPDDYQIKSLRVTVRSNSQLSKSWSSPIDLDLAYIEWEHTDPEQASAPLTTMAYIPSLRIEVVAQQKDKSKLVEMLESSIQFALKRRGITKSLLEMVMLQRCRGKEGITVERLPWNPTPLTCTEVYKREYGYDEKTSNVLKEITSRMPAQNMRQAFERSGEVRQLLDSLTGKHPSSTLLVGSSGVGKTAVIEEMIRLHSAKLPNIYHTSGSRIVAGQTGFGMWQKRCTDMIAELQALPSLLYIGNLYELMQVGQSSQSSESIASFLRPYMMRGDILVVAECSDEQLVAIETHDPKILDAFTRMLVKEPTREQGKTILKNTVQSLSAEEIVADSVINRIDALFRRYSSYSAYPGKPVQFLQSLIKKTLRENEDNTVSLTESNLVQEFSRETGLPTMILDDSIPFDTDQISHWFKQRVMAQDKGVEVVVEMLTTVKARLSRPRKPLASFMFIGPTGVGKTELAKTLAEFLYGNKERIVRFDMSEYNTAFSAQRLVSDSFSQGEGILTSAVREEPFSVILLDEFEKAAPEVYDLFLQVLGEGRLTDGAGRLADFTNAVIIMTSNLGASAFGKAGMGFNNTAGESESDQHFIEAVKLAVRPEFFNRIDRIVPFQALQLESVRKIALRELTIAGQRDGLAHRKVVIEVEPVFLDQVIRDSHDPRYGARPLKRAIEALILLPVAEFLNANNRSNGKLIVDEGNIKFTPSPLTATGSSSYQSYKMQLYDRITSSSKIRRLLHKLNQSSMVSELKSELYRIQQKLNQARKKELKKQSRQNLNRRKKMMESVHEQYDEELHPRKEILEALIAKISLSTEQALSDEERLLQLLYQQSDEVKPIPETSLDQKQSLELVIESFSSYQNLEPRIMLCLSSDSESWLANLVQTYDKVMTKRGAKIQVGLIYRKPAEQYILKSQDEDTKQEVIHVKPHLMNVSDYLQLYKNKRDDIESSPKLKPLKALAIEFKSQESSLLLRNESGLHVMEDKEEKTTDRCYITAQEEKLADLLIPIEDIETPLELKKIAIRREFNYPNGYRDAWLSQKGLDAFCENTLDHLLSETLMRQASEMLD